MSPLYVTPDLSEGMSEYIAVGLHMLLLHSGIGRCV